MATEQKEAGYRSLSAVTLVAVGGTAGTLGRELIEFATPDRNLIYSVFAINILGSFVLAAIYTFVSDRVSSPVRRRTLRLILGTGFMGGFTTYSTFAVGVIGVLDEGSVTRGLLYAAASIVLGPIAAIFGARCVPTSNDSSTGQPRQDTV